MNNIYKVSRTDHVDYDEYDAVVCSAKDEDEAVEMNPAKYDVYWTKDVLKVELIGKTELESGFILKSFNAG